ncbi:MAG TPA: protein kinase [Polyangiaceae bacterium]
MTVTPGPPPSEPCVEDDELMAFALGKLDAERLEAVHAHLDRCTICQQVLAEAAQSMATAETNPALDEAWLDWNTTFRRGTVVGERYVIQRFLARGGMGEVYEAFDRELQQRVALKTVASTACDNLSAVRRLKGEVQLARRVSHPNVCRIYDLGTHVMAGTRTLLHFLTMEFVEGETLGQRVRLAGALPVDEALAVTRELLLALRAAHESGILHRDFKSDNVMLPTGPDARSTAVVLDFGLARALDHEQGTSPSHRALIGTFGYLAPEQIDGQPHSIASDLYSFGVVWFEILTGQLPFEGGSGRAAAALQSLRKPAPAPSSVNPAVPKAVDALVLRCLERAPEARFASAAEVLRALDALPRESPPSSRRSSLAPVALFVALSVAAVSWLVLRTPQEPSVVSPAAAAPAETQLATRPQAPPDGLPKGPAPKERPPSEREGPARTVPPPSAASTTTSRTKRHPPSPVARSIPPPAVPISDAAPSATSTPARTPRPTVSNWEDPFKKKAPPALLAEGEHTSSGDPQDSEQEAR